MKFWNRTEIERDFPIGTWVLPASHHYGKEFTYPLKVVGHRGDTSQRYLVLDGPSYPYFWPALVDIIEKKEVTPFEADLQAYIDAEMANILG